MACWGSNKWRQGRVPQGVRGVHEVSLGNNHSCAVGVEGQLQCWGRGDEGQLQVAEGVRGYR